jgi:hypothetical protein
METRQIYGMSVKRGSSQQPVDLYCLYRQAPMDSHFALNMATEIKFEVPTMQSVYSRCHHPETVTVVHSLHIRSDMEPNHWEANSRLTTREFAKILWNPKFHCRVHWSLCSATSIQSIPPSPTSLRFILISSSHLRQFFPSDLFPSGFPTKTLYAFLFSPYVLHALPVSFSLTWSFQL